MSTQKSKICKKNRIVGLTFGFAKDKYHIPPSPHVLNGDLIAVKQTPTTTFGDDDT